MNGAILLDGGLFETPSIGEEFHNMRARIFMKPWGVWNVADVSADGRSGHFTASAVAKVQGFSFRSGEAHLKIAEKGQAPPHHARHRDGDRLGTDRLEGGGRR